MNLQAKKSTVVRVAIVGLVLLTIVGCSLLMVITQPFVHPITAHSPDVDAQLLAVHVKKLSVDYYPRSADFAQNLNLTADYITQQIQEGGATVITQPIEIQGQQYRNLMVRFGPKQGKLLVIGAHYDSYGDSTLTGTTQAELLASHTPGADDNASGVAGLIALAQLLVKHPPPRPVLLVAYTLEEPPFFRTQNMGSAWHARLLKTENTPVEMMVSLEMIGYFSDSPQSQTYPINKLKWLYPQTGNFISVVGRVQDVAATRKVKSALRSDRLDVRSINAPESMQGIDFSDHLNYWVQGFPALMVTDTAFFRNTAYHHAQDTFDRLDYARMASVIQGVYRLTQMSD